MTNEFRTTHFSLKHRLVARVSQLLDGVVYTQRRGIIRGMKRRGGLGFVPEFFGSEDTPELRLFRELDLRDQVIYDIGAFEGLMTLFFSRRARQVITYEPNPASYARVEENLRLNNIQNVTLRQLAVGEHAAASTLTVDPLMPGAASADSNISELIRNSGGAVNTIDIQIVRLDDDIRDNDLPDPDFVKIDVEGFELSALRGMQQTIARSQPRVYMEMHGTTDVDKREKVYAIIEFLTQVDYVDVLHVESGSKIDIDNSAVAAQGHLFCQPSRS